MVTIQQNHMLDTCKNILEKYITLSFNYSVKHMMNFTLLTCVLLSFYYSGAHIWYILWLKIPRITSDMQNDDSTYWTFTCGILSSLPISSKRKLFVLIPLSKANSSIKYLGTYVFWWTKKPHVFWWTQKIMKGPLKDMRFWVHQKTWGFRRGKKR